MNQKLKEILRGLLVGLDESQRSLAWRWICGHGSNQLDYSDEKIPDTIMGAGGASNIDLDNLIRSVWQDLGYNDRKRLGSVYTTVDVVDKILDEVGYDGKSSEIILDPACGAGAFLIRAAQKKFESKKPRNINKRIEEVFNCIIGADISAEPGRVCRTLLRGLILHWATLENKQSQLNFQDLYGIHPIILKLNSWKDDLRKEISDASPNKKIRWVVGNPPYVERKLWNKFHIERDEMSLRFPPGKNKINTLEGKALFGAADLYMAFLLLGEELVEETDGWVSFVVPNKFQVAKYAQYFRKRLRAAERLRFIFDISTMRELFPGVGVYPIIIGFGPKNTFRDMVELGFRMTSLKDKPSSIDAKKVFDVVSPPVFFTIPTELEAFLEHWLEEAKDETKRFGSFAVCKTTCSFHKKGLREQFIHPEKTHPSNPKNQPPVHPYLGGKSHTKRNEVRPFDFDPFGYTITYDQTRLKEEFGNPLPPLNDTFLQKKIIYCQHALTMVAAPDLKGEWVTKDTYPVAIPLREQTDEEVLMLSAIMNSRVFTLLYHLMFRGIAIGADYLHFLPIYLKDVPMPTPSKRQKAKLVEHAKKAVEGDKEACGHIDEVVFKLYKIKAKEKKAIITYTDNYLGWDVKEPFARK
jgi:hypothetical protein